MGERVPQHIQNIIIKDFCQKIILIFIKRHGIFNEKFILYFKSIIK